MRVMHRADNTDAKNLVIMAVEDISIYFENNVGVVVDVGGTNGSVITRTVSQEHLECDRQRCCAHNRTAPGDIQIRSESRRICRNQENPHRGEFHSAF